MTTETALPTSQQAEASATETEVVAAPESTEQVKTEQVEGEEVKAEEAKKPEKTQEQREIDRLRRRVDNLTRQKYERAAQAAPVTQQDDDDEPVTLTRAEMNQRITEQAQRLAPTMREEHAEIERRQGIVASLAKSWGQDEFDAKASELDDAFGGVADRSGKPKAATDAIFAADDPKAVIEYLTDPDNADEADRISKLSAVQAGRAIARLEDKLTAEKSKAKPKPSNAPSPLAAVKGGGVPSGMPNPSDTKAYIAWANAQEKATR